jgi:fumarylpyruvate hydrolase
MNPVIAAAPTIWAETSDNHRFPIRRVFCIGRNYAAHAREMGENPDRDPPLYFTKWAETVVPSGTLVAYPPRTADFQPEAELVVAMGTGGREILPIQALEHVYGYAVGLDMTRRDRQSEAKAMGRPWDVAKNFEQSSPLGKIHPVAEVGHLADMIWPVADIIAHISHDYRLEAGDLIYTGTPSGVGPVVIGDVIEAAVAGLSSLAVTVGPTLPD